MTQLKNICYRGGIARFDIPASWTEEYEPSGGATFYENRADSGTLRLNVIDFESKRREFSEEVISNLIAKSGYESLQKGLAIKCYTEPATENDERLLMYFWEVAVPVKPIGGRLAIFSYTILAAQANDPELRQKIELLDRSIRNGEYSRDPGVAEDYEHKQTTPWVT